ncbi:TetR family transcriptional regulator [Rhodococcus hoagii]|nr:TetR family transcriptional regulator [Prescottella equi]
MAVATAARDLFVENHSTSVTVEAIAQRAGVSERTFYRHFPTKADIVMPLLERSMDRLLGALAESAGASTGVVDALVDALTEELATDLEDRRELLELLIRTPEYRLRWRVSTTVSSRYSPTGFARGRFIPATTSPAGRPPS